MTNRKLVMCLACVLIVAVGLAVFLTCTHSKLGPPVKWTTLAIKVLGPTGDGRVLLVVSNQGTQSVVLRQQVMLEYRDRSGNRVALQENAFADDVPLAPGAAIPCRCTAGFVSFNSHDLSQWRARVYATRKRGYTLKTKYNKIVKALNRLVPLNLRERPLLWTYEETDWNPLDLEEHDWKCAGTDWIPVNLKEHPWMYADTDWINQK